VYSPSVTDAMNPVGVYDFENTFFLFEHAVVCLLKFCCFNDNPVQNFFFEIIVLYVTINTTKSRYKLFNKS